MMIEPGALRFLRNVGTRMHARIDVFGTAPAPVVKADVVDTRVRPKRRPNDARAIISALLGCWPEPALAVARRIGVTKRELDDYLAGRGTIADEALARLFALTGLPGDASRVATSATSYVLYGGYTTERVSAAYDFLVGDDARGASVEIVPEGRAPAQRWRYLLIMRESRMPSLMCLARFGRSAGMLDAGQLARFRGELAIAPGFYDAVEALRAEVGQRPTRMLNAMRGLCERWPGDIARIRAGAQRIDRHLSN